MTRMAFRDRDLLEAWGRNLRARREAADLTQWELAGKIDLPSQGRISDWENGRTAPTRVYMGRLAALFDCEVHELFPVPRADRVEEQAS